MKKLLIVNNNMHIGGIQKSLANLLNEIWDKYDVTLLLLYPCGELTEEIPKGVKVIAGNRFTRVLGMSWAEAKREGGFAFLWRSLCTVLSRIFGAGAVYGPLSRMQKIEGEFDAGISFMQSSAAKVFYGGCNELVLRGVKAKKKIAFVHCDFENYSGNNPYNASLYEKFDAVACVSRSCVQGFKRAVPNAADKACAVHNCVNFREILRLAEEYPAERTKGAVNIFTAARIAPEKGILRVIPILARLKSEGFSFVWRIAGSGGDMAAAEKMREENKLTEEIVFLGEKSNPYPYFKAADFLLVPSYNEAAPMVFGEARCLGLPVLTTKTSSARELVEEKGLGVVCENSEKGLEAALRAALSGEIKFNPAGEISNDRALTEFDAIL